MAKMIETQLQQGMAAVRNGDLSRARILLAQVVTNDAASVGGWLWLSRAADSDRLREWCLMQAVALDPNAEVAKAGLLRHLDQSSIRALARVEATTTMVREAQASADVVSDYEPDTTPATEIDLSITIIDSEPEPEVGVELSPTMLAAILEAEPAGPPLFTSPLTPQIDSNADSDDTKGEDAERGHMGDSDLARLT